MNLLNYVVRFASLSVALVVGLSCTGESARERAERVGAKANMSISVLDDYGCAVTNAEVEVYFGMDVKEGETRKGMTACDGCYFANGKTTGDIYVCARKTGYYDASRKIELYADEKREVKLGYWQPNKILCSLVLRKIQKPIRLITTDFAQAYYVFKPRTPMGFDLVKLDWVKPWGTGETIDFEIEYDSDGSKGTAYSGSRVKIKFVRPFDGAYTRQIDKTSRLDTVHEADTNETYQSTLLYWEERLPNRKFAEHKLAEDSYLVLRTRSKVDSEGRFLGAQYSMIKGGLTFGPCRKAFGRLYFRVLRNPTFNDPNLEQMNIYNTPNFNQIGSPSSKMDKRD